MHLRRSRRGPITDMNCLSKEGPGVESWEGYELFIYLSKGAQEGPL